MFGFIGDLFNTFLYTPLFNILIWFYTVLQNFGLAVLLLTILIRMLLYPLNNKALKSQKEIQKIQPLIKEIQEKYKENPQKQAEELLALYKEKNFNPFASFGFMFLQIPLIIALYWSIRNIATAGYSIQEHLYSFVNFSGEIQPMFLGMDLTESHMLFALIVAVFQFIQMRTMQQPKQEEKKELGDAEKMQNMMQKQMGLILPVITFFILSKLPSAIGLYWLVATVVTIIQQKIILKKE